MLPIRYPKTSDSLRHHFLLATPALSEGFFTQSLIYICEHGETGAMGIVINQPLDVELSEIFEHLSIEMTQPPVSETVFSGGPVNTEHGYVLHLGAGTWDASERVGEDIWLTTSQDILSAIAAHNGPNEYLVALGYAGWEPGQLEQELAENSWLSVPADTGILFDAPPDDRLAMAGYKLGIDIRLMSAQTGHA